MGTLRFRSEVCPVKVILTEYGPIRRVLQVDALGEDITALWQDVSLKEALESAEIALEEELVNVRSLMSHESRVTSNKLFNAISWISMLFV